MASSAVGFPYTLRSWQDRAYRVFDAKNGNVLINATPGAGKTVFGLFCAHTELSVGRADFVVIVVPTDALRDQWQGVAAEVGIQLATDFNPLMGGVAPDYHGIVTTYQTIDARNGTGKNLQYLLQRKRALAILDEIHHVGTAYNWGKSLADAVGSCYKRLLITGTPFRSDNNPIPFVEYVNVNGGRESRCDFSYGYGDALRDGDVVRPVYFEKFDGEVSWFDENGTHEYKVSDDVPTYHESDKLYHLLNTRGRWMRTVLESAHTKLRQLRSEEDPRAAGLVITRDAAHAWAVARLMEEVIGYKPVVVVSKDDGQNGIEGAENKQRIADFRNGNEEWIVAVKMVSEGVDIKRLRVGVWATNVATELFFRQVVGRVVRFDPAGEEVQTAHFYIPTLNPLVEYAERMKVEVTHSIDNLDAYRDEMGIDDDSALGGDGKPYSLSMFLESTGYFDGTIAGDTTFTPEELEWAKNQALQFGVSPRADVVQVLILSARLQKTLVPSAIENGAAANKPVIREKQGAKLRKRKGPISVALAALVDATNGKKSHGEINRALNFAQGIKSIDMATFPQLEQRVELLQAWRKAWTDGDYDFTPARYLREQSGKVFD